jgi:hypothetical protein
LILKIGSSQRTIEGKEDNREKVEVAKVNVKTTNNETETLSNDTVWSRRKKHPRNQTLTSLTNVHYWKVVFINGLKNPSLYRALIFSVHGDGKANQKKNRFPTGSIVSDSVAAV